MSDRIHDCLDGTIPLSALTGEERREVERVEAAIERSVAFVRRTDPPDVTAAVIERIRILETGTPAAQMSDEYLDLLASVRRALEWLWAPRTIRLRPAWALSGIAMFAVGIGLLQGPISESATSARQLTLETVDEPAARAEAAASGASTSAPEPVLYVRFELEAPGASSVSLAGSFTDWQARHELAETRPGHWTALVALQPGVHDYGFVVDGERWVSDPEAIPVNDGFGGVNSRVALLAPESEEV